MKGVFLCLFKIQKIKMGWREGGICLVVTLGSVLLVALQKGHEIGS